MVERTVYTHKCPNCDMDLEVAQETVNNCPRCGQEMDNVGPA